MRPPLPAWLANNSRWPYRCKSAHPPPALCVPLPGSGDDPAQPMPQGVTPSWQRMRPRLHDLSRLPLSFFRPFLVLCQNAINSPIYHIPIKKHTLPKLHFRADLTPPRCCLISPATGICAKVFYAQKSFFCQAVSCFSHVDSFRLSLSLLLVIYETFHDSIITNCNFSLVNERTLDFIGVIRLI